MTELWRLRAVELEHGYRSGTISPVDAVDAILGRIAALNGAVNCYCCVDEAGARAAARESAARWRAGQPLSDLDGIPFSVKDVLETRGLPTRYGSRAIDPNQRWDDEQPAISRLRAAGAILLGKTTTPEFAHKGTTDSLLHGVTRNPWNLRLSPGGSSGGAAAALAAGMGPLAVGTDGGGSIRNPSNRCGTVGLKPTFGLVPQWPDTASWPLSTPGPMARCVEDVASLLAAMTDLPVGALQQPAREGRSPLAGLTIAWSSRLPFADAEPAVRALVERAAEQLAALGADVVEQAPAIDDPHWLFRAFLDTGMAFVAGALTPEQQRLFEPGVQKSVARGRALTAVDYRKALDGRSQLARALSAFHEQFDVLVLPVHPAASLPLDAAPPPRPPGDRQPSGIAFTMPFNITGQPSIVVPAGQSEAGLPLGIQIVGRAGREDLILRVANAFERASGLGGQLAPL